MDGDGKKNRRRKGMVCVCVCGGGSSDGNTDQNRAAMYHMERVLHVGGSDQAKRPRGKNNRCRKLGM